MIIGIGIPTAAKAGTFDPADQTSTSTNGAAGKEVIPFYGYIGKDTQIVDPDPENPIIPPETEIYVEVPVKVMFAAFESDAGAVSSPDYTIANLSSVNDVKVEIADFVQTSAPGQGVEDNLSLKLTDNSGTSIVDGLFPGSYSSPKTLKAMLPKKTGDSGDNVIGFKIGGTWTGGFDKEIQPSFDMTLKFSVL